MRTSIPEEVKQARRIIQEKERIFAQAQAEAASLLTRAREETERAMNREGLLRAAEERSQEMVQLANEQSKDLVRRAEERTERLKVEADTYAIETLRALREHLMSIEMDVGRTIMSIEKGLESLEGSEQEDQEELEDDEDEEEPPVKRPAPRRSSLAIDTMGGPTFQ
jgi:hypothetical protein